MKFVYKVLLAVLNSWMSVAAVILFCCASFYLGQRRSDMNWFAASGAVMTILGLFSVIRFTTIEKFFHSNEMIARSTGMTGPPVRAQDTDRLIAENQARARKQLESELGSELKGIALTIVGTVIWAYGGFIPVFWPN